MIHTIKHRFGVVLFFVVFCSVPILTYADEATIEFMRQYGSEARSVEDTRETQDDAQFAERLYNDAASDRHPQALTIRLYEKAYHYGSNDVAGYPVANDALDGIHEKDASRNIEKMRATLLAKWEKAFQKKRGRDEPEEKAPDPDALIDAYLQLADQATGARAFDRALEYLRRGSVFASRVRSPRRRELSEAIGALHHLRKLLDEIAELEAQLGTDPASADRLAMIHLTEFDDPEKAATYADRMKDQPLAAQVRLAGKDFEAATPNEARQAGAFYLGLVTDEKARLPVPMLIRAKVWLTEFLSREQGEAEDIKSANAMLAQVDLALVRQGVGQKLARIMAGKVRGKGQFERPAEIQAAIDRGVKWLYEQRDAERHWEQDTETHRNWGGYTALVVYALLMADEDPRTNRELNRSTNFMMNATLKGTYALCFRVHAWEVLPQRERFRKTLHRDVMKLRGGMIRHGFWGYTMTGQDVVPGRKLDMSTTLAGGLGLWIGQEVGGLAPKAGDWERIVRGVVRHQREDGGWAYNAATGEVSHGAMTAGALALLHAGHPHLGDSTKSKVDESITRGMAWMEEHFSPTTNVNRGNFTNYYFAAVQHIGIFAARRDFRGMDWYESIAGHLVQSQLGDGSWGSVQETAFAIAFLCRGGIVYEPSVGDQPEAQAGPELDDPAGQPTE